MAGKVTNKIRDFISKTTGGVALSFALSATPMFLAGGVAVDYAVMLKHRNNLQASADAAALAGAKELSIANTSDDTALSIAQQFVQARFGPDQEGTQLLIDAAIENNRSDMTVNLDFYWEPMMIQFVYPLALPITVTSTATLANKETICIIGLDSGTETSIAQTGVSSLAANGCAVYSNSTGPNGIYAKSGAKLTSSATYSAGGFSGPDTSFSPIPFLDSPNIDDPLAGRIPPPTSGCDYHIAPIDEGSHTLNPGIYCGGLTIVGASNVTLSPGIYVIKDGPLKIAGNATLEGDNIGFYFDGSSATFDFGVSTQVNISAPKTGPLSGLLFFESRLAPTNREFFIRSKDAERFEGTVYLPNGKLIVDKESRVGQLSDWTAIIANQIEIKKGPNLVINSNYSGSDIPLPEGIKATGTEPRLVN